MDAHKVILDGMQMSHSVLKGFLEDFTDAELLIRPVPGANHVAWQLGHLISSEFQMMEALRPGVSPALPAGFAERHSKENSTSDDASKFYTKSEYMRVYDAQREASMKVLSSVKAEELDAPGPESMRAYAPTVGAILSLQGAHQMMHAGQFTVLRRKLGKPVVF